MDNVIKRTGPEEFFDNATVCLDEASKCEEESLSKTNFLLEGILQVLLAATRDGLDYSAKQPPGTLPPEPAFEEDDTRP